MDKGTLMDVVAMIDARLDVLNKDIKSVEASGYSVLSKRLLLDKLQGAKQALERLSKELQLGIETEISAMESARENGE